MRLQAVSRAITTQVRADLAPAARQALIADVARKGLREAQEHNRAILGAVPPHETRVDGRPSEALETVNPDHGSIVFLFSLATDLFEWIDEQLILHSPVLSERYARSHVFFSDGMQADPLSPTPGDEFTFLNTQPYARKIEGTAGRPPQSSQAPEGVYEVVAALAAQRFGNIARVRFAYRSFQSGAIVRNPNAAALRGQIAVEQGLGAKDARRAASAIIKRENATRQPAIVITIR